MGPSPTAAARSAASTPRKSIADASYFTRYVARRAVREGLARRVLIQVAYAIGPAEPVALAVETFGTGNPRAVREFVRRFDFRPGAIIERLGLRQPIYRLTTNCGQFGKPYLPVGV
ncbi:MAG TPA: methionine adenosyltransferase domain-containing protein [Gemmatimonadales bacterium]|nr:methionine adenosyltransferase domain-containing protein [Gemmatimonadales bacterium]